MKRWIFARSTKNDFFSNLCFWGLGRCVHEIWCLFRCQHYSTVQHVSIGMSYNHGKILLAWGLAVNSHAAVVIWIPRNRPECCYPTKKSGAVGRIQGEAFPGGTTKLGSGNSKYFFRAFSPRKLGKMNPPILTFLAYFSTGLVKHHQLERCNTQKRR